MAGKIMNKNKLLIANALTNFTIDVKASVP
jgi:hypothetical protein